jgi:CRP-like cAMP-binding protein
MQLFPRRFPGKAGAVRLLFCTTVGIPGSYRLILMSTQAASLVPGRSSATRHTNVAPCYAPPRRNHLLDALPKGEYEQLRDYMDLVRLPLGKALYEPGEELSHAYFPTTAIVSLLHVMENGASAEIAVVGNEGIVGIALFMGAKSVPNRAVVQSAGHAYRLKGWALKHEFARFGGQADRVLQPLLMRYVMALLTQMAQTAVCNRHHTVDQQLCRWLLLSLDRLPSNELHMTQELVANMLGVRREGVTEAAGHLQRAGLIHYSRGRITVLDRPGLEARVCECYEVVRKEFQRLLPEASAPR